MDDVISRRKAIDALDKCHCGGRDENGDPWIYKENAVEAIEMVEPSALGTNLAEAGTDAISRQAAIKDAESWVAVDEYEKHLKKIVIEWLKEFPPAELGTDCISRQAAIDAINEYMVGKRCDTDGTMMARLINELVIKQLPSIQPKSGRWIHDGSKWTNRWICSECGYKWFFDCIEGAYCPNCGAKMEGTT